MMVVVTPKCPICQRPSELKVPREGYALWKRGELLQVAMRELTADERELLLTGTHPACWDELVPDDDDYMGWPDGPWEEG
jgi:hypothetical protein